MARTPLTNLLTLVVGLLLTVATSPTQAFGHAYTNEHHGAGRRVKMSDIKTLTFYSDKRTAFRRTEPLPQLTCKGKECRRFTPDVVACQSLGDGQWKCEADLPASIRMGRVEVSCEGYDAPSDPYVLKGSCALTYQLLPASNVFTSDDDYLRRKRWTFQDLLDKIFPILFLTSLGWILWGLVTSLLNNQRPTGANGGGNVGGRGSWPWGGGGGGGGGGGPGGGWWPGGAGGPGSGMPPPPYTKQEQYPRTSDPSASASTNTSWRPGFWTGLATGAAGLMMANRNRGAAEDRRYRNYDPYAGSGGLGAGWTGGGARSGYGHGYDSGSGPSREASTSSFRTSAGYGGTRNR